MKSHQFFRASAYSFVSFLAPRKGRINILNNKFFSIDEISKALEAQFGFLQGNGVAEKV